MPDFKKDGNGPDPAAKGSRRGAGRGLWPAVSGHGYLFPVLGRSLGEDDVYESVCGEFRQCAGCLRDSGLLVCAVAVGL